jgi:hypothetical protein
MKKDNDHVNTYTLADSAKVSTLRSDSWVRFFSAYIGTSFAMDLYAISGVRAHVELVPGAARVLFSGPPGLLVPAVSLRAALGVVDKQLDRQGRGLPPLQARFDGGLSGLSGLSGTCQFELTGGDAWTGLIGAFGEAYAEALP